MENFLFLCSSCGNDDLLKKFLLHGSSSVLTHFISTFPSIKKLLKIALQIFHKNTFKSMAGGVRFMSTLHPNAGKYAPEKLQTQILSTQCKFESCRPVTWRKWRIIRVFAHKILNFSEKLFFNSLMYFRLNACGLVLLCYEKPFANDFQNSNQFKVFFFLYPKCFFSRKFSHLTKMAYSKSCCVPLSHIL